MKDESLSRAKVVFRCDGSRTVGFGHMARCLTLAGAFRERKAQAVAFVCRDLDQGLIARIRAAGFDCVTVSREAGEPEDFDVTRQVCRERNSLLITDSHELSDGYYAEMHAAGVPLLSIDDYAGVAYASDIVVNHNIGAPKFAYRVRPDTKLLLGPQYLPIRETLRAFLNRARPIRKQVESLVVALGGMPAVDVAVRVLGGIRNWADRQNVRVTMVMGVQADPESVALVEAQSPRLGRVVVDPSDLAGLLWEADIAVVNGSVTAYEAAAIGTPLVMTAVDLNQADAVAGFGEIGLAVTLNSAAELTADEVGNAVSRLASDSARRQDLATAGRCLVDGRGTERILDAVHSLLTGQPLTIKREKSWVLH